MFFGFWVILFLIFEIVFWDMFVFLVNCVWVNFVFFLEKVNFWVSVFISEIL